MKMFFVLDNLLCRPICQRVKYYDFYLYINTHVYLWLISIQVYSAYIYEAYAQNPYMKLMSEK